MTKITKSFLGRCFIFSTSLWLLFNVTNHASAENIIERMKKGLYPAYPTVSYGKGDTADLVKRGEYLARMGDCISCHTDTAHKGAPFAGGLAMKTPFGTFYSPNITPDPDTGIGKWTEEEFIEAVKEGKSPEGHNYFPVFPYVYFNKMSDQDVRAIFAYLKTVPAVKLKNTANTVPFPFNVRSAQYFWKSLYFYPDRGEYKYDPDRSSIWNRGAYIVEGPGHCSMCHTPLNMLGAPKQKYYLTGAFVDNYWAPNITGEGLKSATRESLVKVFSQDTLINDAGQVSGPMAEVNHESLHYLTKEDLFAIATYLKSVESEQPMSLNAVRPEEEMAQGRRVYYRACATCHQDGRGGAPILGDSANWMLRLHQRGLDTFYRHAINGFNNMPVRGGCVNCTDDEIVASVDFILKKTLSNAQLQEAQKQIVKPTPETGKEVYDQTCSVCHEKGGLGAPKLGDKDAWEPILQKNFDVLIANTLKGTDKMPPKGGCKHCSTSEVISAIKYMVEQSGKKGAKLW